MVLCEDGPEMDIRWQLPYAPQRVTEPVLQGPSPRTGNEGYHLIRYFGKSLCISVYNMKWLTTSRQLEVS